MTDDEYFEIHCKYVNVQSIVEKPYLYILARCQSDDSQVLYSSERLDDLLNLNEDIEFNNKQIQDIMRTFKGANPACQFEAGQQKKLRLFLLAVSLKCQNGTKSCLYSAPTKHIIRKKNQ